MQTHDRGSQASLANRCVTSSLTYASSLNMHFRIDYNLGPNKGQGYLIGYLLLVRLLALLKYFIVFLKYSAQNNSLAQILG